MNSFAEDGFRTLMFAQKELSSLLTEKEIKECPEENIEDGI